MKKSSLTFCFISACLVSNFYFSAREASAGNCGCEGTCLEIVTCTRMEIIEDEVFWVKQTPHDTGYVADTTPPYDSGKLSGNCATCLTGPTFCGGDPFECGIKTEIAGSCQP